jgi:hypothetical protein
MTTVWSLTAIPLRTSDHFRCTRPGSLQRRHIAMTPFPRHTRLSIPSRSFNMPPPRPAKLPVPPSVLLSGSPSPIASLLCTLLTPLLGSLTPCSSQHLRTMSPGRSWSRVPPFCTRSISALPQNSSILATPHRIPSNLLSFQCRHAEAYLDTVHNNLYLRLADGYSSCNPLESNCMSPPPLFGTRCLQGGDIAHAMSCKCLAGAARVDMTSGRKLLAASPPVQAVVRVRRPVMLPLALQRLAVKGRWPTLK